MAQNEDKTLTPGTTNRLAIFCFYDKDGHAGDYVSVFLRALMPHVRRLVIVSNGDLDDATRHMFKSFTPHVIERENKGLDTAAYKQVLLRVGWDQLEQFDEVICCNDTCYGPVYPFSEVFDEMNTRPVDFWGMTAYAGNTMTNDEVLPLHLQAYWHVYRRSLVSSDAFHEYWESMKPSNDYAFNTRQHEIPFTQHFADLGFTWDAYVDWRKYEGYTPYSLLDMPMETVRDSRCPFIKRKIFAIPPIVGLEHTAVQTVKQVYDFVFEHTDYDTDLIWQDLLRGHNVSDLRQIMHLEYILPSHTLNPSRPQQGKPAPHRVRSAFIYHIFFLDLLDDTLHYFANIPEETDAYITTNPDKVDQIREALKEHGITRPVTFIPVENRGRDVSALFVASRDVVLSGKYDVIGFAHDKKSTQNTAELGRQGTEALAFGQKLMENTLGSREYAENVLTLFSDNERLGQVCPPPPYHAVYFPVTKPLDWGPNYDATINLLHRMNINVPISSFANTVSAIGSCYWFRVDALRPLFDLALDYTDFLPEGEMGPDGTISHAIERANGYVAQSQGYYPAWVMTDEYARIEASTLNTLLDNFVGSLPPNLRGITPYKTLQKQSPAHRYVYEGAEVATRGVNWVWQHSVDKLPARISQPLGRGRAKVDIGLRRLAHAMLNRLRAFRQR